MTTCRETSIDSLWKSTLAAYEEKNPERTETLCRTILGVEPDHADALHLLGVLALGRGDRDSGLRALRRSIDAAPDRTVFRINLSQALLAGGDTEDALTILEEAQERNPTEARVPYHLGTVLLLAGRTQEALSTLQRSLALRLDDPEVWLVLGKALLAEERSREAVVALRVAILLEEKSSEAHFFLGAALAAELELEAAAKAYRKAVSLRPDGILARQRLAIILHRLGRLEDAERELLTALEMDPEDVPSLLELGILRGFMRTPGKGKALCERACELAPGDARARFVLGLFPLLAGDYETGLPLYENRLTERKHRVAREKIREIYPEAGDWRGQDLAGQSILVYHEQGLGDTIQCLRYLPLLLEAGARVLFQCPSSLSPLVLENFPDVELVDDPSRSQRDPDFVLPMMSLPDRFGTTLGTIPSPTSYLRADPEKVREVERGLFLPRKKGTKRVGIVWKGNPSHLLDRLRSVPLSTLVPLAEIPGVSLYSLQKGPGREELSELPATADVVDLGETFTTFSDTAAAIENLDLIVSIDSAVAHLSGALGKPTWVLIPKEPDWRWQSDGIDSPWYRSLRLFRQRTIGDWETVVSEIRACLAALMPDAHTADR